MKLFKKRYHLPGTPPGTLISNESALSQTVKSNLFYYDTNQTFDIEQPEIKEISDTLTSKNQSWLRVSGRPEASWMKELGESVNLHPLAQEDVLNGGQRAKLEAYENQLFIVMNLPERKSETITIEHLYLFWTDKYLVTFYTGSDCLYTPLLKRIQAAGPRFLSHKLDFLVYSILDLAIDTSFPVLEDLGLQLESLEERLIECADKSTLHDIHKIKRQIIILRHAVWPQRDTINQLLRDESHWVSDSVNLYLRDCHDHTFQIMDLIESYREAGSSLHDLYLSSVSMRMNDIMRVLTIIATLFIPMTFIAGVYGMNFGSESNSPWAMPELKWTLGYPFVWFLFIATGGIMLFWFRKKRWL